MAKVERKPTQNQRILDYISEFGSITQLDALKDLGVMRLASRVSDLRQQGYPITSTIEPVKNRFNETCYIKRYSLQGGADNGERLGSDLPTTTRPLAVGRKAVFQSTGMD